MDIFQIIVNVSQKQPHWWAKKSAIGFVVLYVIGSILYLSPISVGMAFSMMFRGLAAWCIIHQTSRASKCAELCLEAEFRIFLWGVAVLSCLIAMSDPTATSVAYALSDILFASVQSFAACTPPEPPRHSGRFKFSYV